MPAFKERGGAGATAKAAGPVGPARLGSGSEHSHRAVFSTIFKTPFFHLQNRDSKSPTYFIGLLLVLNKMKDVKARGPGLP